MTPFCAYNLFLGSEVLGLGAGVQLKDNQLGDCTAAHQGPKMKNLLLEHNPSLHKLNKHLRN